MIVDTLAIGAADLTVQALIYICKGNRVKAMHTALRDTQLPSLQSRRFFCPGDRDLPSMMVLHLATTLWMSHSWWHWAFSLLRKKRDP